MSDLKLATLHTLLNTGKFMSSRQLSGRLATLSSQSWNASSQRLLLQENTLGLTCHSTSSASQPCTLVGLGCL
jgi:hypothetical protein